MMTASETRRFRLSRLGFRIALAGGLLFATSFVLPYWDASGAHPSTLVWVFQDMSPKYPQPQPGTCVDSCGQSPLLSQFICFWGLPAVLLPLVPATQAFRRAPHPAAVATTLLELLPTAGVLAFAAANTLRAGTTLGDLASYGSVGGEILGGFVLIIAGNLLALLTSRWCSASSLLRAPLAPTGHPLENIFLRIPPPPPPPLP